MGGDAHEADANTPAGTPDAWSQSRVSVHIGTPATAGGFRSTKIGKANSRKTQSTMTKIRLSADPQTKLAMGIRSHRRTFSHYSDAISYLSREVHVQGANRRHQRWNDEGQDEGLQHPEEQSSDVGHVHNLAFRPFGCKN